jgi:integrase
MFNRPNDLLGANWTLHDLRHTASYRLARDPNMPLTDVQWVLGHAHLTTTHITVGYKGLLRSGAEVAIHTDLRRPSPVQAPSTRVTNVPGQRS